MINTRIWSDTWVSGLDPLEKLLFLYFLTNTYTNISGIYELPMKVAAVETGIDPSMFEKMLPHLEPKIVYKHGWVILPNFPKYQNTESPKIVMGIQRELANVPKDIYTLSIGYGYPIALNLTKLNSICGETPPIEETSDIEEVRAPKQDRRTKDKEAVYKLFSSGKEPWMMHAQQKTAALRLFDRGVDKLAKGISIMREHSSDKWCPQALTPYEYEEKLPKLNAYIKKNGL